MKTIKSNRYIHTLMGETVDKKTVFLVCLVSFVFFWIGILSPIVTDNVFVYVGALVPFYGFYMILYYLENRADCNFETSKSLIVGSGTSAFISSVASLLGVISFFDVWGISNEFFFAPRMMLAVNFIPSVLLVISCFFDKAFSEVSSDTDLYVASD